MVGPHEVEFHLLVVPGLQEAVVQNILKEGTVVEPVPVEDEGVDAVFHSGIYDLLLHLRVGFVEISPGRNPGLAVPFEFGNGIVDCFPFTLVVAKQADFLIAWFILICRPDKGCNIVCLCGPSST